MLIGYKLLGNEALLRMKLKLKLKLYIEGKKNKKKKLMKLYFENKIFIESTGQQGLF